MYVIMDKSLRRVVLEDDRVGHVGYKIIDSWGYVVSGDFEHLSNYRLDILKPKIYNKKPSRFLLWFKYRDVLVVEYDSFKHLLSKYYE